MGKSLDAQVAEKFQGMQLASSPKIDTGRQEWAEPKLLKNCLVTKQGKIWIPPGNPGTKRTLNASQSDIYVSGGALKSAAPILAMGSSRARWSTAPSSPPGAHQTAYESFWWTQQYAASLDTGTNMVNLALAHLDPNATGGTYSSYQLAYSGTVDIFAGLPGQVIGMYDRIFNHQPSFEASSAIRMHALNTLTEGRLDANTAMGVAYVNGPYGAYFADRRWVALSHDNLYLDRIVYSQIATTSLTVADGYIDVFSSPQTGERHTSRVTALLNYSNNLLVCKHDGVFIISAGGDDIPFSVSPMQTGVGPLAQNCAVPYQTGYLWLGGFPESLGIYAFNGGATSKLSGPIDAWLDGWSQMDLGSGLSADFDRQVTRDYLLARSYVDIWNGHLILRGYQLGQATWASGDSSGADTLGLEGCSVAVCNLENGAWSAFDGWDDETPAMCVWAAARREGELLLAQGNTVYVVDRQYPFLRWNNNPAKIILGWQSEPSAMEAYRFMALRLLVWRPATQGDIQVEVTPVGQDGFRYQTQASTLSESGWTELIYPLQFRDASIGVEVEITPQDPADEMVIERAEVLYVPKPQKVGYERRYPIPTGVEPTISLSLPLDVKLGIHLVWDESYWDESWFGPDTTED